MCRLPTRGNKNRPRPFRLNPSQESILPSSVPRLGNQPALPEVWQMPSLGRSAEAAAVQGAGEAQFSAQPRFVCQEPGRMRPLHWAMPKSLTSALLGQAHQIQLPFFPHFPTPEKPPCHSPPPPRRCAQGHTRPIARSHHDCRPPLESPSQLAAAPRSCGSAFHRLVRALGEATPPFTPPSSFIGQTLVPALLVLE